VELKEAQAQSFRAFRAFRVFRGYRVLIRFFRACYDTEHE